MSSKKTQEVGPLTPEKKVAVDTAVEELGKMYAVITEYVRAINGTKLTGATTSIVGGGLTIAGKSKTFFLYFQQLYL